MLRTALYRRLATALLLLPLSACATKTLVPVEGGLAPAMVIERFLRAANSNDLDTMGNLFGTRDGPIVNQGTRQQVDDRMFVLASLLRHSDYRIESEHIVPGRRDVATQFNVGLTINNERVVVPFTLVQSKRGPWLIEQIAVERITQRRS
ncbi:MAG TPA: hypothetical protein VK939_10885 [Longimicrobiales bacterium]|nr:hypothetical protein [Longimicrobiales bacterium]